MTMRVSMFQSRTTDSIRILPVRDTSGFTLVETLVAIAIIMFAVAGPLFSANRSLRVAQSAQDKLTATYLAQEGIEYVRRVRDDTYLTAYPSGGNISANAWSKFLSGTPQSYTISQCRAPNMCTVDSTRPIGSSLVQCPIVSIPVCQPLYRRIDGVYTQTSSGNTLTIFTRSVQVFDVGSDPNEVRVVSTVSWTDRGSSQTVVTTDHLKPWQ